MTPLNIIKLTPGQTINGAGFTTPCEITLNTVRAYATKNGEDPAESHRRAVQNHHDTVWACQEPAALTSNYEGKKEELDAKMKRIVDAPVLEDGQIVEVEGELFRVRLMGDRYADPIHFVYEGNAPA